MNEFQRLWWVQARAEWQVFEFLRDEGVAPCHCLHYLQMVTEKIAKAYAWGAAEPNRSHAVFVRFFRILPNRESARGSRRISRIFGFRSPESFRNAVRAVLPMARELERMAPGLAATGPNPEYPWPHAEPSRAPVEFHFEVWDQLIRTGQGHRLIGLIRRAVERFPEYADL